MVQEGWRVQYPFDGLDLAECPALMAFGNLMRLFDPSLVALQSPHREVWPLHRISADRQKAKKTIEAVPSYLMSRR